MTKTSYPQLKLAIHSVNTKKCVYTVELISSISSTFNALSTAEYNVGRISSNRSWQNFGQKIRCFSDSKSRATKDQKCALLFPF